MGVLINNLFDVDPSVMPISSDVIHVTDGCYFPAMIMEYTMVNFVPCCLIQYLDPDGEAYLIRDRPWWWEVKKVPLTEIKVTGNEVKAA